MRRFAVLLVSVLLTSVWWATASGEPAARVLVIVWDGMRPDLVSQELTPNLFKLAASGARFKNHHSCFPPTTEVNGTVLATGVYPRQSGVVGNHEYRTSIDPLKKMDTESLAAVRAGDRLTGNHYLAVPTVAEILHEKGVHTVIAGTKPIGLLHDRLARADNAPGLTLFEGKALPEALQRKFLAQGPFPPEETIPDTGRCDWTTGALIGGLWDRGVPAYSLLWFSEPDASQHATGLGSPASRAALQCADANLGRVLAELERRKLRHKTDVIVVSDHGFSTISKVADVAEILNQNGFHAFRKFPETGGKPGEIMVVANSGSSFLYLIGHDPDLEQRVVHFLQSQPFPGVILSRHAVEGAFTLAQAHMDSENSPDIVVSMRWSARQNTNSIPGLLVTDFTKYSPGNGAHGCLSPFELHNLGIAAGPHFKRGLVNETPTGNIDIAPTVLHILGVRPPRKMSGRVLTEALAEPGPVVRAGEPHHLEASYHGEKFTWRQYLNYSQVGEVIYFDEGNTAQPEQTPLPNATPRGDKTSGL